jgi:hypothetical protein
MTSCIHKQTHQTITAETNVLDIKTNLGINCGDATLILHNDGGWALPGGGRVTNRDQAKSEALFYSAILKGVLTK